MKPIAAIALAAICPLALVASGCASLGSTGQTALMTAEKGFVVAEQAYDAAVVEATAVVNTGALTPAQMTTLKGYVDAGHGYVVLGRAAITAGDATSVSAESAALTSLVTQLAAALPKKG